MDAAVPSGAESRKLQQEAPERSLPTRPRSATHTAPRRSDRPILFDITNDSPIVGLAAGSLKTPSSSAGKSRARAAGRCTPGSGEALLRGQVKTLLQRVEEEEVDQLGKPPPSEEVASFQALLGHLRSPLGLLAPTPANTPQIPSLAGGGEESVQRKPSVRPEDEEPRVQLVSAVVPAKGEEISSLQQYVINRVLFEISDESDISGVSSLTVLSAVTPYHRGSGLSGSAGNSTVEEDDDDDCSAAWSTHANPRSVGDEDDEDEEEEEEGVYDGAGAYDDGDYEGEEEEGEGLDALCEGLRMMAMEEQRGMAEFAGKHTRFVYNSDDEMVEVAAAVSPGVMRLRGLPAPEGKHLRFPEEEEVKEEEEE